MKNGPLALTLGDPAGIGPEIIVKAWSQLRAEGPEFVVVGDYQSLASASGATAVRRVTTPSEGGRGFSEAEGQPKGPRAVVRALDLGVGWGH